MPSKFTIRDIRRKLFHHSIKDAGLVVKLFDEELSIDEASKKLFTLEQTKVLNYTKRKASIEIS